MRKARFLVASGALLLAVGGLGLALPSPSGAAPADGPGPSATTRTGSGEFAGLSVTVSQTADLIDQAVQITATGGRATKPDINQFSTDYLQVMQCWGNNAAGPDRSQCEFGGLLGVDNRGGDRTSGRRLSPDGDRDPKETYTTAADGSKQDSFVPFTSVNGKTVQSGGSNEFYDQSTTNELPYVRVRRDGSTDIFFETQTSREAPGLGCGDPDSAAGGAPRKCWLVVVPRGETEVDGSTAAGSNENYFQKSSPLSLTNWANRIVFPLAFLPVGQTCPIGSKERPTTGGETVVEAISSWQPTLCSGGGAVYSFSQVPRVLVSRQVNSATPRFGFTIAALGTAGGPALTYAPVAASGVSIAYDIDRKASDLAPDADKVNDGQRVTELNLTPRLIAKLLTQSYRGAAFPEENYLKGNPDNITKDPDFLAVNPSFTGLDYPSYLFDVLEPSGQSDVNRLLWSYVVSDASARDFLSGKADPWGAKVNPFYQGLDLPRDDFPKADPYCQPAGKNVNGSYPPYCPLDKFPYAADLHDAARSASRGDSLSKSYNQTVVPPRYSKVPPTVFGARANMAITDSPTAARFGLQTARLLTPSGTFVGPDTAGVQAGLTSAYPDASGLLQPNVRPTDPTAYPLTAVTYGVTNTAKLTEAEAKDYSALLRYAAGPGQVSGPAVGQLPAGYAPLPVKFRAQTLAAADAVSSRVGATAAAGPSASASAAVSGSKASAVPSSTPRATGPATTTTASPAPASATTAPLPATGGGDPVTSPVDSSVSVAPAVAPEPSSSTVTGASAPLDAGPSTPATDPALVLAARTPADGMTASRSWPLAALLLGLLALLASRVPSLVLARRQRELS